jgi:E3 ubiquitin-protein ligase MYCBP2
MAARNDWHIANNQAQHKNLLDKVKDKAVKRAAVEGLDKEPRLKDQKSEYFGNLEKLAVDKLAYYQCHKCQDPYFGGLKQCGAGNHEEEKKEEPEQMRVEEEP